jgi:hypothetical protein
LQTVQLSLVCLAHDDPEWHRAVNVIRLLDDEIVGAIQLATQRAQNNY